MRQRVLQVADGLAVMVAIAAVLASPGCGAPGPDGPADTFDLDFSLPKQSRTTGAIIFLSDGVNADIFNEMLLKGELPAMKKYFVDRGLYVPHAVTGLPSVTLANLTADVTGLLPGHHGIIANNWFDRNSLIWRNYALISQKNLLDSDYTAPNIYEQFPDRQTFSLFYQPHRGTTKFFEDRDSGGPPFFFSWYEMVDRVTLWRLGPVMDLARQNREFPAVCTVYLLATDFRAYGEGVSNEQYRQALRHADRQIGRVLGDVARAGLLDKIHIAFITDHGMMDIHEHLDIDGLLASKLGLEVADSRLWENSSFEARLKYYRDYCAVHGGSGERYHWLSLRRPVKMDETLVGFDPWTARPSMADLQAYPSHGPSKLQDFRGSPRVVPADVEDLPALLASQEGIDAVAYAAGPNRVRIRRVSGEVEFRQDGGNGTGKEISYHLISGKDPLGWEAAKNKKVPAENLAGKAAPGRAWLAWTAESDFPDLPEQILVYFQSRCAGDIAIFAAPGWDFNKGHKAGHGGIRGAEMRVPMLLAGPGVPHGRASNVRAIDLMPTLLKLMGRPVPPHLDGLDILAGVKVPASMPASSASSGQATAEAPGK